MKQGQLIDWNESIIETICDRIADGVAVSQFAGKDGIPSARSIYKKMAADPEFARRVIFEREAQQEDEMQKCIALADAATPENWQVVKLQINSRQWLASRMFPKKWGSAPDVVVQNNNVAAVASPAALSPQLEDDLQRLIADARERVAMKLPHMIEETERIAARQAALVPPPAMVGR